MATKFGRMVTQLVCLLLIKSNDHLISINTMDKAISFGRVGIYNNELLSINSTNPLIRWSSDLDFSYTTFKLKNANA